MKKNRGITKRYPNTKPCPFSFKKYKKIPGYKEGHGCPFCNSFGINHKYSISISDYLKASEDYFNNIFWSENK